MIETPASAPHSAPANAPTPAPGSADAPPPRRARGRPFKKRDASAPAPGAAQSVPPADGAPPAAADAPAPRRRRTKQIDKAALAKQLQGLHVMAAKVTGLAFVQIDDLESAMLADAIEGVAREYDLELSGKTGAFIQLLAAASIIYGPRVLYFKGLRAKARAEAEAAAALAANSAETVTPAAPPVNGSGHVGT